MYRCIWEADSGSSSSLLGDNTMKKCTELFIILFKKPSRTQIPLHWSISIRMHHLDQIILITSCCVSPPHEAVNCSTRCYWICSRSVWYITRLFFSPPGAPLLLLFSWIFSPPGAPLHVSHGLSSSTPPRLQYRVLLQFRHLYTQVTSLRFLSFLWVLDVGSS